jgi:mRNA interferase RelE/StbE
VGYKIEFSPHASRALRRLPADVQSRVVPVIDSLADTPRPFGAEKLSGSKNTYRIRVGDYRVLYDVLDNILLVIVIDLGHRKEIYRR